MKEEGRRKKEEGRGKFGNEQCTGCNGCNGCNSVGGRRKKEEGRRKKEEVICYLLFVICYW
ncbi:hypothetical protein [Tychonema sp. LEGE 07203]|uniref:hypothetical protein n=1 Tax=Tychonema sp. LEGE 07203 TaxID=1828671 RepID=UPI0018810196|nr:hypothetical protein [Tychonema sp. LEGE 07203]MBE9095153.1 hypothetical protein [Tychonema sp. LEGE 07203]